MLQKTIVKSFKKLEVIRRVQEMEKVGWEPKCKIQRKQYSEGEPKYYVVMEREHIDEK